MSRVNAARALLGWALLMGSVAAPAAATSPPTTPSGDDALRIEAEWGVGHESSSSPLLRLSPDGALVAVDGLTRLSGRVTRASANASGDWPLAGPLRLGLTGVAERREAGRASALGFGLGLGDVALRAPLAGGMVGVGASRLALSVAGHSFRRADAVHVDWSGALAPSQQLSMRVEASRYRHAADVSDLDAEVGSASGTWRWTPGHPALDSLELGWGLRRERNRRGLPELSNRSAYGSVALGWAGLLGAQWTATVMLQRARFDSGLFDGDPARRDRFVSLDLSAEWALTDAAQLIAGVGYARNRARPVIYDNRHRQSSLALAGHW